MKQGGSKMVIGSDTARKFKTKFFFTTDLAEGDGSVEEVANKWLQKRGNIQVVDILCRHEIANSRYKDRSYVGIVYCKR